MSMIFQFSGAITGIQLPIQGLSGTATLTSTDGQSLTWTENYPDNPIYTPTLPSVQITVSGNFTRFGLAPSMVWLGHEFLTYVVDWSGTSLTSLQGAFQECRALVDVPVSLPPNVVDLTAAFAMGPVPPPPEPPTSPTIYPPVGFLGTGVATWDTSGVVSMAYVFQGCSSFDQSLASWSLTSVQAGGLNSMLDLTALSATHLEETLQGWLSVGPPIELTLGCAGLATSGSWAAASVQNTLMNRYGWTFQDSSAVYYYSTTTLTGLAYDVSYQVQVVANTVVGASPLSATSDIFYIAPAAPDAPTGLTVVPTGLTTIRLNWLAPAELNGSVLVPPYYQVLVIPTPGSVYTIDGSGNQTYLQIDLSYNVSYVFQVLAVSNNGNSALSLPTVPYQLNPSQCDPPTSVQAQQSGALSVVVSWNAPANTNGNTIVSYTIQIQYRGRESYITTTDLSLELTDLITNTYYLFSVRANTADPLNASVFSLPSDPFIIAEFFPYYTPKRTETYANISTAMRYSQYVNQFSSPSYTNNVQGDR